MRRLLSIEIGFLASAAGFGQPGRQALLTGRPPSTDTWAVAYLMGKT